MFYTIGKDSTVMMHIARKAFAPDKVHLTLFVDTTWEFQKMGVFRDELDLFYCTHQPRSY